MNFKKLTHNIVSSEHSLYLGKLFAFCLAVGIVAGLGAILFYVLLDWCKYLFLHQIVGYVGVHPTGEHSLFSGEAAPFRRWLFFIVPTLGGLLSGILVYSLAPEAEGHGTDGAIQSYHFKGGEMRARVPLIKTIASALTIGSGGSGGKEGPIAQIGAGFGSLLGKWFGLSQKERRILLISGMAAGIGAIFRAPLAGALFASEVLYREMEFEHEVLIPSTISSVISYSVFSIPFGWAPLFKTPTFHFSNPLELISYLILALVLSAFAYLFVKVFYGTRKIFQKLSIPNHFKPAIGGFLAGSVAFFISEDTLSTSYGILQRGFSDPLTSSWITLLLICGLAKIFTTSFSISSGGSGGVFGPSLVIGGCLGGAVGILLQQYSPFYVGDPRSFVLVGMAGFFAAAANTPLSTVIMVSEITGNYTLLVPSLWVCVLAFILVRKNSLYENQMQSSFETPVHTGEFMEKILKNLTVKEYIKIEGEGQLYETFLPETTFEKMLSTFSHVSQTSFPVLDKNGKLLGAVESSTLRRLVGEQGLEALVIAKDLLEPPIKVTTRDNMLGVMHLLVDHHLEDIFIVDEKNSDKMIGMITRSNFIDFYDREMLQLLKKDNGG